MTSHTAQTINIRPGVTVLSVLQHLNYRPWFALAEFVDNAIQSFISCSEAIKALEGEDTKLRVQIEIDPSGGGRLTIRDNAGGIGWSDFPRAFRPAAIPPDRSGLCEFGMGMKSAACWFAPNWSVRTTALGEGIERSVYFDIERIVRDEIEELRIDSNEADADLHFTEVSLTGLHHPPVGRTLGRIKEHLRDIFRVFVRQGLLDLEVNGESLVYQPPEVLIAPHFREPESTPVEWRKDFDFDFGDGLRAHGFAAIRKIASTSHAGFALFRRSRLIEGSGDETYRPEFIFGRPNTFPYQRVFGEIHLEGFDVSHTKDGFQWDENEQPFLEFLKDEINDNELPLLQQAREYRVERTRGDYRPGARAAVTSTSHSIQEHVPPVLTRLQSETSAPEPVEVLAERELAASRVIDVNLRGQQWRVVIELSTDPAVGDWLEISDHIAEGHPDMDGQARMVGLRLSLVHPFMQRFCGTASDEIEPLLRLAAAIGLSELAARDAGVEMAGIIRRNVNDLLRNALHRT